MIEKSEMSTAVEAALSTLGELPEFTGEETLEEIPVPAAKPAAKATPAKVEIVEVEEEEEIVEEEELSDEQKIHAQQLFKALNNKQTAGPALQYLAQTLGIQLPAAPESKKEAVAQAKSLIEELQEAAPGLEFMMDKIGPVIEKYLKAQVDSVREEVEAVRTERNNNKVQDETTRALTTVATKFKYENNAFPKPVITEMTRLMSKITPTPDLKPIEYIEMLHDAARGKLGLTATSQKSTAKNPATRLASERVSPTSRTSVAPKSISLNEAIANAVEALSGNG